MNEKESREPTPDTSRAVEGPEIKRGGVDPNTVVAGVAAAGVLAGGVGQLVGALKKPSGGGGQSESPQPPPSKPE